MGRTRNEARSSASVDWEGDVFQHHSLSQINRALCTRLIDMGFDVAIKAPDLSLAVDGDLGDVRLRRAARPRARRAGVTVRHSWPPKFSPRPAGRWVHVQPWEFGGVPDAWTAALQAADEVWCPSRWVRDRYLEAGLSPERVQVVPNGVDLGLFKPEGRSYHFAVDRAFRFLFVGGFIPRKGIDVLVNAYRAAFRAGDDVCLVLKGFGAGSVYANGLHEQVRALAASGDGPGIEVIEDDLSDEDMARLYRSCDVLVHPYRGEGFAMPVAEAMASGVPVVVTGAGATADFCDDGNAWLLPSRRVDLGELPDVGPSRGGYWLLEPDLPALVELLKQLPDQNSASALKAARGRQTVTESFGWDSVAATAAERLRALAGSGPAHRGQPAQGQAAGPDRGQVYFLCGEEENPGGGMRVAYRHARLLAESGVGASVLHLRPGYRCPDIDAGAPVTWVPNIVLDYRRDIIAVPEVFSSQLGAIFPGAKKVIFNQNPFLMFKQWPVHGAENTYGRPDVMGSVCVSAYSAEQITYALPGHPVERVHLSVDAETFAPGAKEPVLAVMPRKSPDHVVQVVSILRCRGVLEGWEVVSIDGAPHAEVAELLSSAAIFLSTGTHEAFPLSLVEAMASGCIVVGYDGFGGAELLGQGNALPVPSGDVLALARQTERAMKAWSAGEAWAVGMGPAARRQVEQSYPPERERADVVAAWQRFLDLADDAAPGDDHGPAPSRRAGSLATATAVAPAAATAVAPAAATAVAPAAATAVAPAAPPARRRGTGTKTNRKTQRGGRVTPARTRAPNVGTEAAAGRLRPGAAPAKRPLLSACLIVKDEEKALPDCLASLQGLADEVVVYDTGSTDSTVRLAREAGAKVIEGYWDDDFSRARNASLEHCRGEWVLWIDADERFAVANPLDLRAALVRGVPGDALAIQIYNLGDDPEDKNINIHRALRLFRNDLCCWYGAIHEQVDLRAGIDRVFRVTPLEGAHLDHIGYRSDVVNERNKLERNLRLAEAALERNDAHRGQEGVDQLNVGRALAALGRYEEAQQYFDASIEEATGAITLRACLLFSAQNLAQIGHFQKAAEQARRLRDVSEHKGLAFYFEGVCLRRLGQPAEAVELFEQVQSMTNEDGFVFPTSMLRAEFSGALLEAGRPAEAADQLVLLVEESPEVPVLRTALKVFASSGKSLEDLVRVMPENRLDKMAAALILVPPVVADPAAEVLFERFGPKPQLLAAAIKFAPLVSTQRALEWSARLRAVGLNDRCPLVAQAAIDLLEVPTRIRAAVTAHAAFGDTKAAELAVALVPGLHAGQIGPVLGEVAVLDPPLLAGFAEAAAAPGAPGAGPVGSPEERRESVAGALAELGREDLSTQIKNAALAHQGA